MDDSQTRRELYKTPVDYGHLVLFGSDAEFAAIPALLDEIGSDTIPTNIVINCSTFARCAYFLKRFKIPVDAIARNVRYVMRPELRDKPFSTTLLNLHCIAYQFAEPPDLTAEYIRGLLGAGARVDLVSALDETPLETFHRSALALMDEDYVTSDVEGVVHAMLCSEGHSSGVFHDGVKRILAGNPTHPGFETLRNYEVVEAFAAHSHTLPMELCRMVACAMGVPP